MTEPKIKTISVHELKKRRDLNPELCLIDVREVDEWEELHIPGAMHIPKDSLVECIRVKVPDHDKPIYLHCRGGVRSLHSANDLITLGYTDVYSVDGGIMEWAQSGYPIE
jgi:rhodanese-related sulfurtransferase